MARMWPRAATRTRRQHVTGARVRRAPGPCRLGAGSGPWDDSMMAFWRHPDKVSSHPQGPSADIPPHQDRPTLLRLGLRPCGNTAQRDLPRGHRTRLVTRSSALGADSPGPVLRHAPRSRLSASSAEGVTHKPRLTGFSFHVEK